MSWFTQLFSRSPEIQPDCVGRALYQGWGWRMKKLPYRFVVQNIQPGVDHIQCQVFYNNEWRWSTQWKEIVTIGDQEERGRIIKVLTMKQLLQERIEAEPEEKEKAIKENSRC